MLHRYTASCRGTDMIESIDPNEILTKYLTNSKRIAHSVSTGLFMEQYADVAAVDPKTAYIAGTYHDLAKDLPLEEMVRLSRSMKERGIYTIDYFDYKVNNPSLLHGVAASELLYTEYGVDDKSILTAIAHHTTGGAGLDNLAKWTFLADFIEPLRDFHDAVKIRKVITKEHNFGKALGLAYTSLLQNLLDKHRNICPESLDGYNESIYQIMDNQ